MLQTFDWKNDSKHETPLSPVLYTAMLLKRRKQLTECKSLAGSLPINPIQYRSGRTLKGANAVHASPESMEHGSTVMPPGEAENALNESKCPKEILKYDRYTRIG